MKAFLKRLRSRLMFERTNHIPLYRAYSEFLDHQKVVFDPSIREYVNLISQRVLRDYEYTKFLLKTEDEKLEERKKLTAAARKIKELAEKELRTSRNRRSTYLSTLQCFRFILPPRHREEFLGDITEIHHILNTEGHAKIWIYLFLLLNVANVLWVSFRFKWREYFEKQRTSEKK